MILSIQDFVGKYALHTGMYDVNKLQDYIDIYEPRYLKNLLGIDLYNQFQSDLLNNVPQSPNFIKIFNEFSEDLGYNFYTNYGVGYSSNQLDSEGILQMLKGFIYFEYSKDLVNQMTPYGNVKPLSENSEVANTGFSMIYTRYNEAIRSYRSIQSYIRYNNPPIGQAVLFGIVSGGSNYVATNNVALSGGFGTGLIIDFTEDGAGVIDTITIADAGKNYKIGDTFTIPGGNDDAIIELIYVGIGNYNKFRGIAKSTAYWL